MPRRRKDLEARIKALEEHVEESPTSPAFFPLAALLWKKGQAERAEGLLRSGLSVHPAYSAPRVLLGEILLSKGLTEEAADALKRAAQSVPWNLAAQRLLAECLRKAGDETGARRALRAIGMFDPSDEMGRAALEEALPPAGAEAAGADEAPLGGAEALPAVPTPSLAELYLSQGHHAQAAEVYRRLLEVDPGNEEWRKRLDSLREWMARGAGEAAGDSAGPGAEAAEVGEESPSGAGALVGEDEVLPSEMEVAGAPPAGPPGEEPRPRGADLELGQEDRAPLEEAGAGAPQIVPPEEVGPAGEEVDPILEALVRSYVDEGNLEQALDVCRKVSALVRDPEWLAVSIEELERRLREIGRARLRDHPEGVKDETVRSPAVPPAEVVRCLEGWLRTLQGRRARGSAGSSEEAPGGTA